MSLFKERNAERLNRSIMGQKTDHHAVFNFYTYPFFASVTGASLDEYFHKPQVMFEAQLEAFEQLDGCGNFTPDEGAAAECSALGGKVRFDKNGYISVAPAEISEVADVLKMVPGDPYGDNYMRYALDAMEYMVQHCPSGYKVNPHAIIGPFTVGAQLIGISDFCMYTISDPALVDAVLDIIIETQIKFLHAQEKILGAPLHHVLVCDDISALVGEKAYRRYVLPSYERLFAEFPGTQRWLHNDARAKHIARDIPEGGFTAWQYHPSLLPIEARTLTGGRTSLLGGLDPIELAGLTQEQTFDKCNQVIDSFAGDPRCVLAAGGSVNQVPLENLRAMFKAADERKIGDWNK